MARTTIAADPADVAREPHDRTPLPATGVTSPHLPNTYERQKIGPGVASARPEAVIVIG